jgi:hypothetical protein
MKTIFAVAVAAFLSAAPAFAQEEYQTPALRLNDHVAAFDTGSAPYPQFTGQGAAVESETVLAPNASEAGVESLNSLPPGFAALPGAVHR